MLSSSYWKYLAVTQLHAHKVVNLLCVNTDKFPYLSKNGLEGKAELSLDEACHFTCCCFSLNS